MNKNEKKEKEKEQPPKVVIPKGRVLFEIGGTYEMI
jgi:hypothetical protein